MDTQTQIDRLIELAIIQRSELKQLVEQLPQLREHLNSEVEKVFDETEPQLRSELEEWTTKQTADKTAALGVTLEAKIAELAKSLEVSTQARYNAIIAEREENSRLAAQAEAKIAEHAASLPGAVKEIVSAELARFPRAGEIEQLRKEFAEPRGLNPRGKWQAGESYNKLDFVTINGDSYTSNIDNNRTRPSRSSADWTLVAARGTGGGGGPTSLSELTTVPSDGDVLIGSGTSWVTSNLTAGAGISITVGPGAITISATDGDITLDDGTAASPSLHFTNDPDTGIYRPAANTLGISVSGTQVAYFDQNGLTVPSAGVVAGGSFHGANGNANNPSYSFSGDQDTGFFRHQPNEIGIALGGTQKATLTSTTFTITPNLVVSGTGSINGTTIPASKTLVVTTDKLSALASTSSSELAGVISDETGTGSLVFANTPTLVTPVIGAATGTSLTVTGNVTASDAILGTSGPSVKSTLSARAPRQGLVFDGTARASYSIPAFGTGDFSVSLWINQATLSNSAAISGPTNAFQLSLNRLGNGYLSVTNSGVAHVLDVNASNYIQVGKFQLISCVRSSGTVTFYVNGIAVGSGAVATDFSAGCIYVGGAISTAFVTGTIAPYIYNRALSAAEVVALYEAGAPAGADYNSASNTSLSTSALTAFAPFTLYSTFSSANGTSFSASDASANRACATNASFSVSAGQKILVSFTLTQSGSDFPQVILCDPTGPTDSSNAVVSTAGANNITLTATRAGTVRVRFFSFGASNYSVSGLSVTRLGLLLAPDAAQAGGGLVWYDTSGNAANITLPASGVSWNVPSSLKLGGNWTVAGTFTNISTAQLAHTYTGAPANFTFGTFDTSGNASLNVQSNANLLFATFNTERARITASGNLLLKSDGIDSGNGKLQLAAGAADKTSGIGFGTDVSLYRSNAGYLTLLGTASLASQYFRVGSQNMGYLYFDTTDGYVSTSKAGASLVLRSGNEATALTLDSSQNATFAGRIGLTASGTNTIYSNFIPAATGTYAGVITMQAGGGSATYGGSLSMYGASHATKPGWVSIGMSNTVGAKFAVNTEGLSVGVDAFTIDRDRVIFIYNAQAAPSANPTNGGYLYVESGALKYRGSSGTVTTIANA